MRKVIAAEFMTLHGVIQNEENDGDGFSHGGWSFGYADETPGQVVRETLAIWPNPRSPRTKSSS